MHLGLSECSMNDVGIELNFAFQNLTSDVAALCSGVFFRLYRSVRILL